MPRIQCPNCGGKKWYSLRRGSRKCAVCRREWRSRGLPLRLTRLEWRQLLRFFVLGLSSNQIPVETGLSKKRVLRALRIAREVIRCDVPGVFSGIVEVDETYLGGQWKNKPKTVRDSGTKRGRGTNKQPVFGIYCRSGLVWAELVDDVTGETLLPLITKRVTQGSIVCSDTFPSYTGVASKGYVHRLVNHSEGEYRSKTGAHINGLEGFWGYLKRKLASKGGIRQTRLPLYLAEYVWRYNNRHLTTKQQTNKLQKLIQKHTKTGGKNVT